MFNIVGIWKMITDDDSKVQGDWTWIFRDDGSVIIEEILGPEARMPVTQEASYENKGNKLYINYFEGGFFPATFDIKGNKLYSKHEILEKIGNDVSGKL